jgi:hypothetical protein
LPRPKPDAAGGENEEVARGDRRERRAELRPVAELQPGAEAEPEREEKHGDEDAAGVGQRDPTVVAAVFLAEDHHLVEPAGHAGEEGGHRVEPAEADVEGDHQRRRDREVEGEKAERQRPARRVAQHFGGEARAEHHADHDDHYGPEPHRREHRRAEDCRDGVEDHRPEHPGQRNGQGVEDDAAERPEAEGEGDPPEAAPRRRLERRRRIGRRRVPPRSAVAEPAPHGKVRPARDRRDPHRALACAACAGLRRRAGRRGACALTPPAPAPPRGRRARRPSARGACRTGAR